VGPGQVLQTPGGTAVVQAVGGLKRATSVAAVALAAGDLKQVISVAEVAGIML